MSAQRVLVDTIYRKKVDGRMFFSYRHCTTGAIATMYISATVTKEFCSILAF